MIFGSAKGVLRAGYSRGRDWSNCGYRFTTVAHPNRQLHPQEYDHFDGPAVAHVRTGRIIVEEADNVKFEVKGEAGESSQIVSRSLNAFRTCRLRK